VATVKRTKRAKPGRPPTGNVGKPFNLWMPPALYKEMEAAAKADGRTVANWIVEAIKKTLGWGQ
jgi:predicted HicB family RNase H-like nuclease